MNTVEEDSARRTLLTLAVRDYGDGDAEFTAGIDEQLSVVADWWCAPGAPEPFTHVPAPELRERYDVERFLHESKVRETRGRALVVFITGHGQLGASRTHFLQLPRTEPRRQLATAIRTSEIVAAALDSRAEHVLVVINTCYAAGIAEELEKLHQEILPSRRTGGSLDVVATCAHDQLVQVRQFPSVMRRVLERLRTTAQITTPWLSVAHLMTEFESELGTDTERRKHRLKRVLDGGGQTALTPCLPNPGYRPVRELVGPARRQVATPADEVDHWLDRASGRPQETDPGWYFSGREGLGRAVTAFLGRPRGVLLLTGTAGSGKSAVLARAVTLSDPLFRDDPRYGRALRSAAPETVPPEGSVTAAVLARHRTASDVLGDLLRALELPPRPAGPTDDPVELRRAQLLAHLDEPGDPVTLVLDGLDESVEPFRVVRDVLAPLTAHCGPAPALPGQRRPERQRSLRLLIGVRSSRPRADRAAPPGPAGRRRGCSARSGRSFPRRPCCVPTRRTARATSPTTSRRWSAPRRPAATAPGMRPRPSPSGSGRRSWTPGWPASSCTTRPTPTRWRATPTGSTCSRRAPSVCSGAIWRSSRTRGCPRRSPSRCCGPPRSRWARASPGRTCGLPSRGRCSAGRSRSRTG